jgi:HAD superfamily hydrolase (TIGR01549 family)
MMKPLICFDMDNTLLKSDKVHVKAFNLAFEKHGVKRVRENELAEYLIGTPSKKILKVLFPSLTLSKRIEITNDHDEFVVRQTYKYALKIGNVVRVLKRLRKDYDLALITNCRTKEIKPILRGAGIDYRLFSKLIGHDMVAHEKPWPDLIFKAERLTHHKACCMVGDSVFDVRAAKRAGIKAVAVLTGHHTREDLKRADEVVRSITYLPGAINRLLGCKGEKV